MAKKPTETKTTTVPIPTITSREEMVNAVGQMREWEIRKRKLEAKKAKAVLDAEREFAAGIDEAVQHITAWHEGVKAWSVDNREEFGERQFIETVHGKVKLYLGAWGTKLLPKFTWDKVVKIVKSFGLESVLLRTFDPEPDKEAMLAYRNEPIPNPKNPKAPLTLEQLGVTCERGDFFEVELKIEEIEAPAEAAKEAA